jgi:hypothetical protein
MAADDFEDYGDDFWEAAACAVHPMASAAVGVDAQTVPHAGAQGQPCSLRPLTASSTAVVGQPGRAQVVFGTCGWSDKDAPWAKAALGSSAAERLAVLSVLGEFGCVEVDTSCYQIVDPAHVARWVAAVPPGFKFCFKAFGFL